MPQLMPSKPQHAKRQTTITTSEGVVLPREYLRAINVTIEPFTGRVFGSSTPVSSPPPRSPPPSPCPWVWRCHSCYTIYRLSVTRRCLDCDHEFCLGDAADPSAPPPPPKGKKRKRSGPCKAEFDYVGWKSWGAWRRTKLLNGGDDNDGSSETNWGVEYKPPTIHQDDDDDPASTGSQEGDDDSEAPTCSLALSSSSALSSSYFEDKREHLFLRRQHNCFLHCDFPSECHHTIYRAQQQGKPILREALALDAAREAVEARNKTARERLTMRGYEQRRAARRRNNRGRARAEALVLPTLFEEGGEAEADEEDNVSPCSPTSPGDPPGDLMREVSPVEREGGMGSGDDDLPVSPGGTRRRSLLVATDTPADFATTARPPSVFEEDDDDEDGVDFYSDGDDEGDDDEQHDKKKQRRAMKSRRQVVQLTGSLGPFMFESFPSPPSPTLPTVTHAEDAADLEAAYSEKPWFPIITTSSSEQYQQQHQQPLSPKSPERAGRRDAMLALLGRRSSGGGGGGGLPTIPPRFRLGGSNAPARNQPQHAEADEEWSSSWSSSNSSSSTSSTSTAASSASASPEHHPVRVIMIDDDDDTDVDGDVTMRDVALPGKDGDEEDEESPVSPVTFPIAGGRGAGVDEAEGKEDLRVLLQMRNAFMRGDMI